MDGPGVIDQGQHAGPIAPLPVVTYEPDSFARSLPDCLESDFVRCGPGDGPARVEQVVIGDLTVSFVEFGFPVSSRIESDGVVAVARILKAPAKARWGDADLAAGQIRSMGPKRHHCGFNPAGVVTLGVFFDADLVREVSDLLGHRVDVDNLVGPLNAGPELNAAFDDVAETLARPGGHSIDERRLQEDLLAAVAWTARQDPSGAGWTRSFVTSDQMVDRCLDFARSTSTWQPGMADLCRAAGMSERRVRSAFLDATGMAPSRYLRVLALNRARTMLQQVQKDSTTVTAVADELGFHHLSRFAHNYRALFDEYPSDTLRA